MFNIKYSFKQIISGFAVFALLLCVVFSTNNFWQRKKNNLIIKNISEILHEYALTYDIDKRSIDPSTSKKSLPPVVGFNDIQKKIATAVKHYKPIEFNLVGFPYKSQNTEKKVLISVFDDAEKHSLAYLNIFLNKIANTYSPGANLTIFTDGTVFCDIEKVHDSIVADYEQQLKQATAGMPHIHIKTLSDLLPNKKPQEIRYLIQKISPTIEEFEAEIAKNTKLQEEISLLEKRMALEFNYPEGLLKLQNTSVPSIAKKIVHRGMQYSKFLESFRPKESIRLSVHYQPNVSKKIGIKLSHNSFVTPWHGILVTDSEGIAHIVHKEDANSIRRNS